MTSAPFLAYTAVGAWLPDGRVAYNSPWQINLRIDLMVFDPSSGAHESRLPDSDGQLFGLVQAGFDSRAIEPRIVVDPSGEWAYVYIQKGGSLLTTRVALRGDIRVERLTEPSYSAAPLAVDGTRLLAIRTAHTEPANLVVIDTQTGSAEARSRSSTRAGLPSCRSTCTTSRTRPLMARPRSKAGTWHPGTRGAVPDGPAHPRRAVRRPRRDLQSRQPAPDRRWLRSALRELPWWLWVRRRTRQDAHRRLGPFRHGRPPAGRGRGRRTRARRRRPGGFLRPVRRRLHDVLAA